VEIGTEAAQFPGKEFINGIFLAVQVCNQFAVSNSWYKNLLVGKVDMYRQIIKLLTVNPNELRTGFMNRNLRFLVKLMFTF
jgi:hypothetical protein